jgi:hypothetical protein
MQDLIEVDRVERVVAGKSRLVSPWDVVPLDPATDDNVREDMYGRHKRFGVDVTLQSAEAYYAFQPERVAHCISPRPLLIVHGVRNCLHPVREARSLFEHAGEPKQLIEIPGAQHLDWIQPGSPLYGATVPRIVEFFQRSLGLAG